MASFLSAVFSLTVLAILLLNWLAVPIPEKQLVKKVPEPVSQLVKKPTSPKPPPQSLALPLPPKVKVAKKEVLKSTPRRQKSTITVKALKPSLLKAKPVRQQSEPVAVNIQTVSKTKKITEKGRTLLRLLEHGAGPAIEFAWPDSEREKSRLYQLLAQCHGMRIALLDRQDRLFVSTGRVGEKWQINLDLYSTFMRQISGQSVTAENQEITRIRQRQPGLSSATPMRIFTRQMDAYILGGIGQIIGAGYRLRKSIRARYLLEGNRIIVTGIVADGMPQPGRIQLACPHGRRL
jgi:hypothetical protein